MKTVIVIFLILNLSKGESSTNNPSNISVYHFNDSKNIQVGDNNIQNNTETINLNFEKLNKLIDESNVPSEKKWKAKELIKLAYDSFTKEFFNKLATNIIKEFNVDGVITTINNLF